MTRNKHNQKKYFFVFKLWNEEELVDGNAEKIALG